MGSGLGRQSVIPMKLRDPLPLGVYVFMIQLELGELYKMSS